METKQEIVSRTLARVGAPDMANSTGSTELKGYLIAVVDRLGLGLDTRLPKPQLAEAIVRAGGQGWTDNCYSSGSTVTATGLRQVEAAVEELLRQQGA